MSLTRNISHFVNFDQGHERKNLKVRENSVIFDDFGVRHFSRDQGQNRKKARCYELKTSFYFILQKTVWFYLKNPKVDFPKFSFTVPSNEDTKNYELQVACKDYIFMGADKLVGASSIGLSTFQDKG